VCEPRDGGVADHDRRDADAHCGGQACYDRKLAEGKTPKEAFRSSSGASAMPSTAA